MRRTGAEHLGPASGSTDATILRPLALGLAVIVLLAACGTSTPDGTEGTEGTSAGAGVVSTEVVFAGPGGVYEETFTTEVFPAFEEATGIDVIYESGGGDIRVGTLRAERSDPTIDVFWSSTVDVIEGTAEGLFEPLDMSRLPNAENYLPAFVPEGDEITGIDLAVLAIGLFYNDEIFTEEGLNPPEIWEDLWSPEYAGRVGLITVGNAMMHAVLVQIAELNGGDVRDIEPALDRFEELRTSLFAPPAEVSVYDGMLQQGNVAVGIYHAARIRQLENLENLPISFVKPEDGVPVLTQTGSIINDAPHPDAAYELLNYLLSVEFQEILAPSIGYGPVIQGIEPQADLEEYLVTEDTNVTIVDWAGIAEESAGWLDEWERRMAG